jgi:hypothetical protein
MPFNFKKYSNSAFLLGRQVKMNVLDRRKKHDLDVKNETQEANQLQSANVVYQDAQVVADIIQDKIEYEIKELKRRQEPIDKQHNLEVKYRVGNNNYKSLTDPYNATKDVKDERTEKFRKNLIKLTTGKLGKKYKELPDFDLKIKPSLSLKDEQIHFEKQQDKCYYCGRDLYSGKFSQTHIHLEHLIDKSNWIDEIIYGEKLLIEFFNSPPQDISDYEKASNDASYIKSVIKSNAVNSLQNWMYADAECNQSKMDLTHYDFINFMEQIQFINTPGIINKNKEIYKKFALLDQNYKDKKPGDVIETGKSKSYEIYHEYLSSIIENFETSLPEDIMSILYLSAGTPPGKILEKIIELEEILKNPQYSEATQNTNFMSRNNSFNELIRDKKASDFKDKKTIFATKNECHCGICGKKTTEPSPLNRTSSSTLFDITDSLDDFQWQLVHTDCASRCGYLSVRTLRFLAQKITKYKPEREKITKSLGSDIEGIYKAFKKHLNDLEQNLSFAPAKAAFNFYRFIRRGGR